MLDKWKANLAVLISNTSSPSASHSQPGNDRRVAAELGDRLWAVQGRVEAAHCCYLLAELPLGPVDNPSTRIVLLGADHKRKRPTTATNQMSLPSHFLVNIDAIIRSEIYEWTKVLGNSQYVLPGIHPYKLVYASFLADLGLEDIAAKYPSVNILNHLILITEGTCNNFPQLYGPKKEAATSLPLTIYTNSIPSKSASEAQVLESP